MDLEQWDVLRQRAIKETPEQWCVTLAGLERRMKKRGFTNLKDVITTPFSKGGLGLTIEDAIHFINFNPAYEHRAKGFMEKLGVAELAKQTEAVGDRGLQDQPGRGKSVLDKSKNIKYTFDPSGMGGTSKKYRIAKLKRDHPDVVQRLMDGEFKTVSAAERAAGIERPLMSKVDKLLRAFDRLDDDEQFEFTERIVLNNQ